MDIAANLTQDVLAELQIIKQLLFAFVIMAFYFLLLATGVIIKIIKNNNLNEKRIQKNTKAEELEELLSMGKANAVKFSAQEWINIQPNEPNAHWYFAQALYQLGDLIGSKKSFENLLEVAPNWEGSVIPWLEKIQNEIPPKVVK